MASRASTLGVLLPQDGPDDYEWYALNDWAQRSGMRLPNVAVAPVPSDGHHDPQALRGLGATERLIPVAQQLMEHARLQALVWACTSASFIGGLRWAHDQAAALQA